MKLQELFEGLFEGIEKQHPVPFESPELSMNHKERMVRAKSLGFDINNIFYHGTVHNFKSFDPKMSDSARNTGTPLGAIVLSSNPIASASYAGEIENNMGDIPDSFKSGGNVMPLFIRKGKTMIVNAGGRNWNDLYLKNYPDVETVNDLAYIAQSKGKDTLIIKSVHDTATWVNKNNRSKRIGDTIFIFKPENIRSIYAKFDQVNIHSENLMD
jgi:hypothetical protein